MKKIHRVDLELGLAVVGLGLYLQWFQAVVNYEFFRGTFVAYTLIGAFIAWKTNPPVEPDESQRLASILALLTMTSWPVLWVFAHWFPIGKDDE